MFYRPFLFKGSRVRRRGPQHRGLDSLNRGSGHFAVSGHVILKLY